MTQLARHATVPQLRRAVARHAFPAADPAPEPPAPDAVDPGSAGAGEVAGDAQPGFGPDTRTEAERRACARPELSMSYDSDGRFHLRYSAPATIGALVEQAVREAKDALFTRGCTGHDDAAHGPGAPTYADALEEVAHRSFASVGSSSRRSRHRVYLHLDTNGAWVNGGHAIPLRLLGRFITDGRTAGRSRLAGRCESCRTAPVG